MIDPFAPQYPPVLLAATRLLNSVIRCCWPRIPNHCNDIVKALTICWLDIEDEEAFPLGDMGKEQLKSDLARAASSLSAVMDTKSTRLSDRTRSLMEQEPLLKGLFQRATAATA
jgi:hypothetical protein